MNTTEIKCSHHVHAIDFVLYCIVNCTVLFYIVLCVVLCFWCCAVLCCIVLNFIVVRCSARWEDGK